MSIKLAILDYDLTTMYNVFDFYEAYMSALKRYGGGFVSFDEFMELLNQDRLSERIPSGVDKAEFWLFFRRVYVSRHSTPMDGVGDFLRIVKGLGGKTVIVSGRETSSAYIWMDLRMHGLDEYVDEVYTIDDLARLGGVEEYLFDKSWIISYVLEKYAVEPCRAVCLGDFTTDLLSCRKLGVPFIGVNKDEYRGRLLKSRGAIIVVKNFHEAIAWLPVIREKARC